jgi:hypothetical protein
MLRIRSMLFRNRNRQIELLVILLGLVLASCSLMPDESLMDRSFLTEQPCAPPCWYGLELDKSNKEEVYVTLKTLPFVIQSSIVESNGVWPNDPHITSISYRCPHQLGYECGHVVISGDDKLVSVVMIINYSLTFEAVVQRLGPPDYVSYSPHSPEGGGCDVGLHWPEKQISVGNLDTGGDKICQMLKAGKGIDPTTKVGGIGYNAPQIYEQHKSARSTESEPWPGFEKP